MTSDRAEPPSTLVQPLAVSSAARVSLVIIAIVMTCAALYLAATFFIPLVMAILISLTFGPLTKFGTRFRIPSAVSAAILILGFGIAVLAAAATLATPFAELIEEAPRAGEKLKQKLEMFRNPVESINKMGEEMDKITDTGGDEQAREVVVKGPGLINRAADDVLTLFATGILILVLSFFLLVSRDLFFRKAIRMFPKLSDKKKALSLIKDIERDVSRYLLTVSMINMLLGITIGGIFYMLGMPTPHLWVVLVALLNFLPYVGALIGVVAATAVSIITFDTLQTALLPPAFYLLVTFLEGQLITPMILGRRFSLNTVVILSSIAFWGFMWGAFGVLVAVPILIILKVLSDRLTAMTWLSEFLSGEDPPDEEPDEETPAEAEAAH